VSILTHPAAGYSTVADREPTTMLRLDRASDLANSYVFFYLARLATSRTGGFLMSIASAQRGSNTRMIGQALSWGALGLCLALLVGYVAYDLFGRTHLRAASSLTLAPVGKDKPQKPGAATGVMTVYLTNDKFRSASITTEPVRDDRLATEVGVVGVIQVNLDRQVAVRPRAGGIVRSVHARLGQNVKHGDLLITLDSADVGTARLNLRARQRELATARYEADWKSHIAANVALLIPELRIALTLRRGAVPDDEEHVEVLSPEIKAKTDTRTIEKQFADKQLGAYRGTLLQAYAEFDIASHEEQKTKNLKLDKVMGEHPALVARHNREGIQAKLEAAIEQVRFDAAQGKRLADQQVRLAESAVIDAAQRLRILGVSEDIPRLLARAEEANSTALDEDVTIYEIVAPFDGTIIKRSDAAVPSERADLNDVLFTLADLRSVWVTANVSESDVAKLPRIKDGVFRLTATAYPNREYSARLLSVGAIVDPQTRTVSLLAETDNREGLFKLGMFVRINLDSSATENALTVPASAIVEIENAKYVFVPVAKGPQNRTFRLQPVEAGRQAGERVVITAGLTKGDPVVSTGAFMLKSELILQNQTDDE
jgi:membrane fusion protein, heavy metal efflux system